MSSTAPATEPPDEDRPPLKITDGALEFRDVAFSYRPGEPTIRNMSFVAEPGRMTALVGPSGGGKSTVLNLILRFYEVSGGVITIDDQDIASVSRRSLRSQVSYVSQDVFLFRATIRENIAFGRPGASDADIVAAAKAAQAHDFISALPEGLRHASSANAASGLSGGERQRIAIARALIKDAPLILLDEATASLDSESEHYVQKAIAELCKGRTTLVIAHRLSDHHACRQDPGDRGRAKSPTPDVMTSCCARADATHCSTASSSSTRKSASRSPPPAASCRIFRQRAARNLAAATGIATIGTRNRKPRAAVSVAP